MENKGRVDWRKDKELNRDSELLAKAEEFEKGTENFAGFEDGT